jgi:hypothetical protein
LNASRCIQLRLHKFNFPFFSFISMRDY